jgi:hypothetical protein
MGKSHGKWCQGQSVHPGGFISWIFFLRCDAASLAWPHISQLEAGMTFPGTRQGPCGSWEVIASGIECRRASRPQGYEQRQLLQRTVHPLCFDASVLGSGSSFFHPYWALCVKECRWRWTQHVRSVSGLLSAALRGLVGAGCREVFQRPHVWWTLGRDFLEEDEQIRTMPQLTAASSQFLSCHVLSNLSLTCIFGAFAQQAQGQRVAPCCQFLHAFCMQL